MQSGGTLCILTCASFAMETAAIAQDPVLDTVVFITYPDRCGRPSLTWDDVRVVVGQPDQYGAIRIFGGCCLASLGKPPADLYHCQTTRLEFCFELVASKRTIARLVSEGAYLVSSGWLVNWRHHIAEWGFTGSTTKEFFADCSRTIVLLDTATSASAVKDLEQFSALVDRPCYVIPVGLDQMRFRMELCLETWRDEMFRKAEQLAQRQLSDYAMAFDLLSTLARSVDEADIIRQTANLYQMLFAASEVAFIRFSDGCPVEVIYTDFAVHGDCADLIQDAKMLTEEYRRLASVCGFMLKVKHGKQVLGVVRVAGITFPEYVDTYLSLALATIGVCGLALHNARIFHEFIDTNRKLKVAHTDLQNSHMQLLQQEKMASIGQLAAGIAHEINNPMGFITSNLSTLGKYVARIIEYLEAVDRRVVADSAAEVQTEVAILRSRLKLDYVITDTKQLIEESLDGATRVKNIVDDLKNLSRMDKLEMVWADWNKILETALNIACNEIKYVADIVWQLGNVPKVLCYPQQLSQVFINLLTNASHAIDGHGTITIRTWHEGNDVFASVADTGRGISEDILNRIFEPFFTTKDVGKGTGLGLSISYDIIRKHGGDISVESIRGSGSIFIVRLPNETDKGY